MLKRASALLLVVTFMATIFGVFVPNKTYAEAPPVPSAADWIDRTLINANGKYFRPIGTFDSWGGGGSFSGSIADSNDRPDGAIYMPEDSWTAITDSNSDSNWDKIKSNCLPYLIVNDFDNDGTKGTYVNHYRAGGTGNCVDSDKGSPITLNHGSGTDNRRFVTAYRVNDDNIFLPVYKRYKDGFFDGDEYTAADGYFRRWAKDDPKYKDWAFPFFENGKWDNISEQGVEVHTSDNTMLAKRSGNIRDLTDSKPLTFANAGNSVDPGTFDSHYGNVLATATSAKGSAGGTTGGDTSPDCESTGPLSWLLCAVFNAVATATDWLFSNLVEPLLRTSPVSTDPANKSFQVWSSFRLYGNVFLVIALLVLVFGQTVGGGLIDAYTAKKMAPRILVGAILINLSIYIVAILVDITNIVGGGIGTLMIAPFKDSAMFQFSLSGVQSGVIGGSGVALVGIGAWLGSGLILTAIGAAFPVIALFVLLPAALGLLGAFVTLVLRQGLILFLILSSPVAFALYCLPNTEKYFRKWWDLFFKALLIYPIVIVIFAVADIMTVTIQAANGLGGAPLLSAETIPKISGHVLAALIAFVLQFLPLVLIPFAFKFAGGVVGSLYATLSGHGKRFHEAVKGNVNDPLSLRNKTKLNYKNALIAGAGDRMSALRDISKDRRRSGLRRRLAVGQMRSLGMVDWERKRKDQNELFDKEISGKVAIGADTLERAFFARPWNKDDYTYTDYAGNSHTLKRGSWYSTYRESDGTYKEYSAGDVANSHRIYDGNESKIQTLIKYETGKVSNDEDFYGVNAAGDTIYNPADLHRSTARGGIDYEAQPMGSFLGNLPAVMSDAGLSYNSATGASIGSFFATQTQRKELKHTKLQADGTWKQDTHAFVQDWAENIGSYAASTSKTSPIKRLTTIFKEQQAKRANVAAATAAGTTAVNPRTGEPETWTKRDEKTMEDMEKIAAGLDTRLRGGYGIGTVTEDGTPIPAGSGGAGRVNAAIQEFVSTVMPAPPGGGRGTPRGGPLPPAPPAPGAPYGYGG